MTLEEFSRALYYIARTTPGKIWPHFNQPMLAVRLLSGAGEGFFFDQQHPATEQEWLDYGYNPPGLGLIAEPLADDSSDVRPKPTYAGLVAAAQAEHLVELSRNLVTQVNRQCTDRIAEAYHPGAAEDRHREWQVRLSGVNIATQDAERVRLIAVCHAFEVKISAAVTLAEFEAINPDSEALWSGAGD